MWHLHMYMYMYMYMYVYMYMHMPQVRGSHWVAPCGAPATIAIDSTPYQAWITWGPGLVSIRGA